MAQTHVRNHAQRGNYQHYARITHSNPQRHVVPIAVLTRSKFVPLNVARPVTTVVPHNNVTRPRPAKIVITKPNSPPRRNITHRTSPNPSNFPQKITTTKVPQDDVIEQVQRKEKEDNDVLRYQALKRKPQIEAQARKNMMVYLKNTAGFKMDYFKGMRYDDIRLIFEKYFNSNVQRKEKEDNDVLRYQALKRNPQTEAQAKKNMMIYLKNMAGFKMDYFKGMSYDAIHPIFEKYFNSNVAFLEKSKERLEEKEIKALKRTSESLEDKVAKKQKLDEKVEELKKHLQIVPNNDDNVYTKATPLALKVPVVDYEINTKNNKPYYKIIRADGTHQLFLSFLSLLRNFNREELEVLWQIVKKRFASSKPKNFSDDFLLTTLTYMYEKPNIEAQVWKNQRGVHGLAKVKRWRLLESNGVHIITFTTT
nr:hypothetical protein [Tanacetum cinerariifolium]